MLNQKMNTLIRRLKKHEGFKGYPYPCPRGYPTIGYGHRLPITERQAEAILIDDVYKVSDQYMKWKGQNKLKLTKTRDRVLMELIFWHGFSGFLLFKRMIQALKDKNYDLAADEMMDSDSGRKYKTRMYELSVMMRDG
jgi:lysozyme